MQQPVTKAELEAAKERLVVACKAYKALANRQNSYLKQAAKVDTKDVKLAEELHSILHTFEYSKRLADHLTK